MVMKMMMMMITCCLPFIIPAWKSVDSRHFSQKTCFELSLSAHFLF